MESENNSSMEKIPIDIEKPTDQILDSNEIPQVAESDGTAALKEKSNEKPVEFTSEIYKVEVKNLPKNAGFGAIKKFIASLDLKVCKVKSPPGNNTFAFVTFSSEEERQKALKVLNEATFKGRKISACVSSLNVL